MILHAYFAHRFLFTFLALMAAFSTLLYLIDLMEQLRIFSKHDVAFSQILVLTLLHAPENIHPFLPLIMTLSTVALFLSLARSSELVAVRAAGRAALVTLLAPVATAFVIGLVMVTMFNPFTAATSKQYMNLAEKLSTGAESTLSVSGEGLWLRQGGREGQTVIHAARSNSDGTALIGVTFVAYAPGGGPVRRIEAASAELIDGAWLLHDAKVWPLIAGLNPEAGAVEHDQLEIASSLDRDRIRASFTQASAIAIWDLPGFIRDLEQAGFSPRRHLVWLHMELALPLFLVAMVLIASALTMRPIRFGRVGLAVLTAVMMGFALHYIRNFARILGENGQLPYLLAAWAPPVASVMLALGLLLHMEEG